MMYDLLWFAIIRQIINKYEERSAQTQAENYP